MTLETRQTTEVGIFNPPEIVLENARTAAKALADIISRKKKPVIINGEQYLEYEDWMTVAQFYGYTVKTGDAMPVEIDGVKGAKAHADLIDIKTGLYLGGAEAYCMRDEEHWNTRPRYEWQGEGADRRRVKTGDEVVPWFQLASMAQTRAGAKAFRNRLAWVVVLAGYRPTPAEEMTEGTISSAVEERRTVDPTAHYCSVHNVNFFKKGRMKGYSHPIEGTNPVEWCNEPSEAKPEPIPATLQAPRKPVAEPKDTYYSHATAKTIGEDDEQEGIPVVLITPNEENRLKALLATYQMDIKALGNWLREHNLPVPTSLRQMPKATYDKIMGAFKESPEAEENIPF